MVPISYIFSDKYNYVSLFTEKECTEIELPEKKVDDFVELLHCMYPPIKPVTGN